MMNNEVEQMIVMSLTTVMTMIMVVMVVMVVIVGGEEKATLNFCPRYGR